MIRATLSAAIVSVAMTLPACAADLIEKISPHSVTTTMDRLAAAVEGAGATIFARIDHAAGASSVDLDLRPTELLIFGNPKLGTPAMLDGQSAGLDLPLRVLAFADSEGMVHINYHAPESLAAAHGLPADAKYIQLMTGAMDKLTSKAIAQD
ncbi:DUF302 domain-containing protein [Sulfitobacter sp. F26204]|uniref:DUF302 domain-containing protein n=1 Tax=Sulfitobacter sp. F26204 TaxID=2996014 RepID=UPI00225E61B8|nr:DUF302 domain-containing protein [Sulfitobacter sp. F26204]MCX7560778.1 DUF302 domain-containing protein [Sulfitobacter sp. F26204]